MAGHFREARAQFVNAAARPVNTARCTAAILAGLLPAETGPQKSYGMKRILVGIKRVVDYNVRIRVKPDGSGVVTDGVKMSINPFDEIALEEALRIKERGGAEEVIVATIGPGRLPAAAAHRARHGRRPRHPRGQADGAVEPLTAARALLKLIEQEQPAARDPRQAGDRRRQQPDRPDAGGAVGPAAGHVRLARSSSPAARRASRARSTPASRRSRSTCRR